MSENKELFDNYCLDKFQEEDVLYPIKYRVNDDIIRRVDYNFAFKDKVKGDLCYVLFNEDDEEDVYFTYVPVDCVEENDMVLFVDENTPIRKVKSMTIYEYASLLSFKDIYNIIKKDIDKKWDEVGMDELIEEGVKV